MKTSQTDIARIVSEQGLMVRRQHPELAGSIAWSLRQGRLRPVLPGVYAPPATAGDLETRIWALALSDPDAVLTGRTAARVSFWPKISGDVVECATRRSHAPQPGYCFRRRVIPPDLVREQAGLRITTPALTALDLSEEGEGEAIDHLLRSRAATLPQLWQALELTSGRPGNRRRRELLLDSRNEPWSAAERRAHRLLRAARITGWRGNHPVVLDGHLYYLDIAFPRLRLVVEIDGRLHEDDSDVFESDRHRQNHLVLQGWTVLRFTWRMLVDEPEAFVAAVLAAVEQAG